MKKGALVSGRMQHKKALSWVKNDTEIKNATKGLAMAPFGIFGVGL